MALHAKGHSAQLLVVARVDELAIGFEEYVLLDKELGSVENEEKERVGGNAN